MDDLASTTLSAAAMARTGSEPEPRLFAVPRSAWRPVDGVGVCRDRYAQTVIES
ncbi:hypothetical protein ACH4VR_37050 [Streptomyces sp. NPDC020883]|uniref:hypothetical protein n=1 Tax=unclassified Streptomyces TaxID=2593676 RepID=UPI0034E29238